MGTCGLHRGTATGLLLCAGVVCGCATQPMRDSCVPDRVSVEVKHPEKILITVVVGETLRVNAESSGATRAEDQQRMEIYRSAVTEGMKRCELYQLADTLDAAAFKLNISLLRFGGAGQSAGLTQGGNGTPSGAFLVVSRWCLKRKDDGATICEKDITSFGAHDAPDYILGGTFSAQAHAFENAAAANIRAGLEWLARRTADL